MAKKSGTSIFGLALYALGGYLIYENWPAISAWATSLVPLPSTAGAPAATSAYYPNSPVPIGTNTSQLFTDSAGNEWAFSTQTGQWVIAVPAPSTASTGATPVPAPSTLPSGTIVATEQAPVIMTSGTPVIAQEPAPVSQSSWQLSPASPGTVVPVSQTPPDGQAPPFSTYYGDSFGPRIVMLANGRTIVQ